MRTRLPNLRWLVFSPWWLLACNLIPTPGVRGPSPEPPAPEDPRHQVADRDGNDRWEDAGQMTVAAGEWLVISGQLGAVDRAGVLDQVDYYRFQARHGALLLRIDGAVAVDLVTASDLPVTPAAAQPLWYDQLSLDGGYAVRVRPRDEQVAAYTLTLAAGAGAGAACSEHCRFGLFCVDDRCAQDSNPGEPCLDHGDCRSGQCGAGVCGEADDRCDASAEPAGGCRSCSTADDCLYGDCQYGFCIIDDGCEPVSGAASGQRCRGGQLQVCSAGSWHDTGRCDTGCWDEQCAPLPTTCLVAGATRCLGAVAAVCVDGVWHMTGTSAAGCRQTAGLEGAACGDDAGCGAGFACLPTMPGASSGVCALACDSLGATCQDGKRCGAGWDSRLYCLAFDGYGCDLAQLRGCPGAVAGACVEGQCWPGCYTADCPGAGCACGAEIDCRLLDPATAVGNQVGICLSLSAAGEPCGGERLCEDSAVCVVDAEGASSGTCRALCSGSCPGDLQCVPLSNGQSACLPA